MKLSECEFPEDVARVLCTAYNHGVWLNVGDSEKAWREYSLTQGLPWVKVKQSDEWIWERMPQWVREKECFR